MLNELIYFFTDDTFEEHMNPHQKEKGSRKKNCFFNSPSHKTFMTLYENSMKGEENAEWKDDAPKNLKFIKNSLEQLGAECAVSVPLGQSSLT